ncbi:hypothetical protein IE981_28715 [Klebsiella pneumoniae]|nr:hypothetical protein [Klebsiella pneumoniae]MBD3703863.1 hypothetical protein [Klebsiella pneumoniae]
MTKSEPGKKGQNLRISGWWWYWPAGQGHRTICQKFHATLVHIAQLHIFTLGQAHLIEHGKAGTKARNQYGFQIDPAARNNFRGCFIDVKSTVFVMLKCFTSLIVWYSSE